MVKLSISLSNPNLPSRIIRLRLGGWSFLGFTCFAWNEL